MPYLYNHWHLAVNLPANMKFYKGQMASISALQQMKGCTCYIVAQKSVRRSLFSYLKLLYNMKSADFYSDYPERAVCFISATSDERQLLIFVIRHQTIQINRKRENYDF